MVVGSVTIGAIVLLFAASVIHSWYAGNASLPYGLGAGGYRDHRGFVLAVNVLLLMTALILMWWAKGFWSAAVGAGVYFFLLPLITYPLLNMIGLVPIKLSCQQCGSEYEILSRISRGSDSIECEVCGHALKRWQGSPLAILIKRGEWPRKESTRV